MSTEHSVPQSAQASNPRPLAEHQPRRVICTLDHDMPGWSLDTCIEPTDPRFEPTPAGRAHAHGVHSVHSVHSSEWPIDEPFFEEAHR